MEDDQAWTAGNPTPTYAPAVPLPLPPTIVVGREDELRTIVSASLRLSSSHIAILGPGGIGKTALALMTLHDPLVEAKFSECRAFVKCDGTVSAEGVVAAIASQFNVAASKGLSLQAALINHLRYSLQPVLLGLDNLESAWDTDEQELVESLLTSLCNVPALSLIATMRGTRSPDGQDWLPFESLGPLRPEHGRALFLRFCEETETQHDPRLDELLN